VGLEFVTQVMEIDPARLWVSVYEDDDEASGIWQKIVKVPADKIRKFGPKDNFWPSNAIKDGPNGPCGPCSEIYYEKEGCRSVEVWNLVFTQLNRCDGGLGANTEEKQRYRHGLEEDVFRPSGAWIRF
jgi:alanyl-tRNA synthetase